MAGPGKIRQGVGVRTDPPLAQVAKRLREADRDAARELGRVHRKLSKVVVDDARENAAGLGAVHAKAATAIAASGDAREIKVLVSSAGRHPYALLAVLGTKRRTGWYRRARYRESAQQHPAWIGNQWEVGAGNFGREPYAVNPAIRDNLDAIVDAELGELERLFGEAFLSTGEVET